MATARSARRLCSTTMSPIREVKVAATSPMYFRRSFVFANLTQSRVCQFTDWCWRTMIIASASTIHAAALAKRRAAVIVIHQSNKMGCRMRHTPGV
jgi:hypothetical protein